MKNAETPRTALNGLRFYFTIPMLLCHFYFLKKKLFWGELYERGFNNGGFSVTFFMLLSGFVITLGYRGKFGTLTKEEYIGFVKGRVCKFYPIYCITMLYAFLYEVVMENSVYESMLKLLNALTMSQTLTIKYYDALNSPLWYISCLVILYLLTPLFLKALSDIGNRTKVLMTVLVLLYCAVLGQIKLFETITRNGILTYRTAFILFYGTPYCRVVPYLIGGGHSGSIREFESCRKEIG